MFGHFGLEWDIREAQDAVLLELKRVVTLYKENRALIHSGKAVHADLADPAYLLHGVVAQDSAEALYAFVCMATSFSETPGRVALPGLAPSGRYHVSVLFPSGEQAFQQAKAPAWISDGADASGRFLAEVGLPMPGLRPEHALLLRVLAIEKSSK